MITEGELRHFRKQAHLERKKEAFYKDKVRPELNSDAISDDGESDVMPDRHRSPLRSEPIQPGEAVVIDIASMKRLYAGRLGLTNTAAASAARKTELASLTSSENSLRLWPSLPGQKTRRQQGYDPNKVSTVVREVAVPDSGLSLRELASKLSMKIDVVRKKLEELGESFDDAQSGGSFPSRQRRSARKTDSSGSADSAEDRHIDADVAELLVLELGLSSTRVKAVREMPATARRAYSAEAASADQKDKDGKVEVFPPRYPIVCIMGHVDHGMTHC